MTEHDEAGRRGRRRVGDDPGCRDDSDPVPDVVEVEIPPGGRLVVVADLRLRRARSDTAAGLSNEVARVLEEFPGPCTLVLAGDTFDLTADAQLDPGPVLATHQRLTEAIAALSARPAGRVIVLPGNRDASLAWHRSGIDAVVRRLGAQVSLAVDAHVGTGCGEHRVRIEPGMRFDPLDARDEVRNPAVTTLGDHARRSLDGLAESGGRWLDGIEFVADPTRASAFIASRLFYRRLLGRFGWLLAPVAVAFVLAFLGQMLRLADRAGTARAVESWAAGLAIGGVALVAVGALFAFLWWSSVHGPLRALSLRAVAGLDDVAEPNDAARAAAGRLVAEGRTALVTGHTGEPELTDLGSGFYANPSTCGQVAVPIPGRFGAPDAWVVEQRWSWLSMDAGAELSTRLHLAVRRPPSTTLAERLLTRGGAPGSGRAEVVAEWPGGADWPVVVPHDAERRRARRIGAVAIGIAGLVNLVSAVVPPVHGRVEAIQHVVPLAVSQAAAMTVALSGLLLLLLSRGIRRGQRHAWLVAEVTLAASFALHLVKGLDFEEAIIAGGVGAYLFAKRRWFRVRADDFAVGRALSVLFVGLIATIAAAVVAIKALPGHRHPHLSWFRATEAAAQRLVGSTQIHVGGRFDQFSVPVMVTVAIGLVAYAGWSIFRPVLSHRLAAPEVADSERARVIVERSGGGSLAWFALRDDKRWFFFGDTVVAYAVVQGVALVSPDPIGPVVERRRAWFAFRQFADDHGWPIAVMGAAEEWLPIYRSSGMHDLYVGDEAVVDVRRFTLDGPRNKAVRQAVNRVANRGYTISFEDPAQLEPDLEAQLRGLMGESRRGETERGFSMTLGRVFDPRDTGLLLAVCRDAQGTPVAFCQYVPAPGIQGYSLDLMRRSESDTHPNGLTDFVLASTMLHLKENGYVGLTLNFATMRAVLAGERGDGTQRRMERWLYRKMSDSMQIESLWRYNAKFDPDWVPRYACYDAPENLIASATALAKAESWWEIPVIGRFFRTGESDEEQGSTVDVGGAAGSGEDAEPLVAGHGS